MSPTATRSKGNAAGGDNNAPPTVGKHSELYLPAVNPHAIDPSADNPRDDLGDLTELKASIAEHGVLQPLTVSPKPGTTNPKNKSARFTLIFGHRRLAAAKELGVTVPVLVREDLAGTAGDVVRLVENLQRSALTPVEEAKAYRRLLVDHGMRQVDVAEQVGKTQGHISKRIKLLDLPISAQQAVDDGTLVVSDALELARMSRNREAVDSVLADIKSGVEPAVALRRAQVAAERQADRKAAVLAAQHMPGKTAVSEVEPVWSATNGPYPLRFMPWVDQAAHAEGDCHLNVVLTRPQTVVGDFATPADRWVVMSCLHPANHPDPQAAPDAPTPDVVAEVEDVWASRMQILTAERRDFIGRVLRSKSLVRTAANEHMARALLLGAGSTTDAAVLELAASWVTPVATVVGAPTPLFSDGDESGLSGEQLIRSALALRLAIDEQAAAARQPGALVSEHLRYLERLGYVLEPEDRELAEQG